jgi:hypothetical protein
MTRQAIIIESSTVAGLKDLPGARKDTQNWTTYLCSEPGGAWELAEITVLNTPSWATLSHHLNLARSKDYVFIAFSGHGFHEKEKDETYICLNSDEDIPASSINPGNPRCTVVFDSCRGLYLLEKISVLAAVNRAPTLSEIYSRIRHKQLFESAVNSAEKGIIRLYSASLDESAAEDRLKGGYYSTQLISSCERWYEDEHPDGTEIFTVREAHAAAARIVTARFPQQNPQYDEGRRLYPFPLAIKASFPLAVKP